MSDERSVQWGEVQQKKQWDVVVIGGGATGLGAAVEAASRGYRTLLLERDDFAKGTSSRSTKLAHGGVRYLEQMNVTLVLDALRERGYMLRNAPHIVHKLGFVVPIYNYTGLPYYGFGLKIYEWMSGKLSSASILTWSETISPNRGPMRSATNSSCAAAAMSSSTCSMTAAPSSGSRPAAMWIRSCHRCRRR